MSHTKPSKGEKELTQRIAKLEMRWTEEHREAQTAQNRADQTRGIISELRDAVSAMRSEKTARAKKVSASEAKSEVKGTAGKQTGGT